MKNKKKTDHRKEKEVSFPANDTPASGLSDLFTDLPEEYRPPGPDTPRGRILAAARELFAVNGLNGTSTRAIAEKAAVNLAMIHYYFGSKESLYERVLATEFIGNMRKILGAIRPNLPPHEMIMSIPQAISTVFRTNPIGTTLMRQEIPTGGYHLARALRSLEGYGPLGLKQRFDMLFQVAVNSGHLRPLPVDAARECLLMIAWGSMIMHPFLQHVFGRNMDDEDNWNEWQNTSSAILRHGLLVENSK